MMYQRKKQVFTLVDTLGALLSLANGLSEPRLALVDCIDAATAIESAIMYENPPPVESLDMISRLREDFVDLFESRITPAHSGSLTYYLGLIRQSLNRELEVSFRAVFLPYSHHQWKDMAPLYEAIIGENRGSAAVVPIPYLKPADDDMRLLCDYGAFPRELPLVNYREFDAAAEHPDLLVYGDLLGTDIRIHRPFSADSLRAHACLTFSLPSMQGLPSAARDAAVPGDGVSLREALMLICG